MNLFKKYIQNRFINKLLFYFICIITVTFLSLSLIIGSSISQNMSEKELQYNDVLMYNVNQYMDSKYKLMQTILYQAFMDKAIISNVFDFLNDTMTPYSTEYYDTKPIFDNYMNSEFSRDPDLTAISFYKFSEKNLYQYTKVLPNIFTEKEYPHPEELDVNDPVGNPHIHIYPSENSDYLQTNNRLVFTLSINISSRFSDNNVGILLGDFDLNGFTDLLAHFNSDLKSEIIILTPNGEVVFDSANTYYGRQFPYWKQGQPLPDQVRIGSETSLFKTLVSPKTGLTAISMIPLKNVNALVHAMRTTIYLLSALCISICIILMTVSSYFLSKRIKIILNAMKKMRGGHLSMKIPISNQEDEIGQIAVSFNRMSESLSEHIEKSYVSELKQKHAELTALQAQINPHFLYNTLEAIRMKAVSGGDNETSQMIYILAEMFKSTIKSEPIISMEQEIRYCEQYLQLFKIRYGELFSYTFEMDEDMLGFGCINHLLQPLFENYIVHGFSPRFSNNKISLKCSHAGEKLTFVIEDTGKGIPIQRLKEIQEQLAMPSLSNTKSIGLLNVNERIKLIFGKEFGLSLQSELNKGTRAVIIMPAMKLVELRQYVQSINR